MVEVNGQNDGRSHSGTNPTTRRGGRIHQSWLQPILFYSLSYNRGKPADLSEKDVFFVLRCYNKLVNEEA
jgi:hypothetical protein